MYKEIIKKISDKGGKGYIVGGAVRDNLLGIKPKDIDIEVFHLNEEELRSVLSDFGNVVSADVGPSNFPVWMVNGIEVSMPRVEKSTGPGHKDFEFEVNPELDLGTASLRRDFTMNAMFMDLEEEKLIDPHKGALDLKVLSLNPVSESGFSTDPLRVLRGMQFCSRFELTPSDFLLDSALTAYPFMWALSKDRVLAEFKKWAIGKRPSNGIAMLFNCGWSNHFPEISRMQSCPQDPEYHPEGDVLDHTLLAVDYGASLEWDSKEDREIGIMSILLHDCGKPETTEWDEEKSRWISPSHAEFGKNVTVDSFFERLMCDPLGNAGFTKQVKELVGYHMVTMNKPNPRSVRRFIRKFEGNFNNLWNLIESDSMSRGDASRIPENLNLIKELYEKEKGKIEKIVKGRDLISDLGWEGCPELGEEVDRLYEIQINEGIESKQELMKLAKGPKCQNKK